MSEIGTAYVRVRPQMSSFKAEAQTGIRSAFGTVGRVLLPTIAFAGVTEGIRKSVQQAELKQVVQGQLEQAFRQVGLSFSQNAPQVEAAIKNQERLGFTFDESAQAMTRSVRATSNVGVALKLQAAAADLARGQNIGLLQATQILIRAYNGQSSGLKRLGVTVAKHSKGVEVLTAVQEKFSGSSKRFADSAAGAQQRLSASVAETEAIVGSALLPTVGRLNTRLANWLDNTENQKKVQDAANKAVKLGGEIVHDLGVAFNLAAPPLKLVASLLGGFGNVVEKALVIGIALKARKVLLGFDAIGAESRLMTKTIASGSATSSAALTKTGVSGARSATLLQRALIGVGSRLTGVSVSANQATSAIADGAAKAESIVARESELLGAQAGAAEKGASGVRTAAAAEARSLSAVAEIVARKNELLASQGAAAAKGAAGVETAAAVELRALSTLKAAALDARAAAAQAPTRIPTLVASPDSGAAEANAVSASAQATLASISDVGEKAAAVVADAAASETALLRQSGAVATRAGLQIEQASTGAATGLRAAGVAAETLGGGIAALGTTATLTGTRVARELSGAAGSVDKLAVAAERASSTVTAIGAAAARSASDVAASSAREAASFSAASDVVAEKNALLKAQGAAADEAASQVRAAAAREEAALGSVSAAATRTGAATAGIAAGLTPVIAESEAAARALQQTGEGGQRAAGLVSAALSAVVTKFGAVERAAAAASAKIVSSARAEAAALRGAAAPVLIPTLAPRASSAGTEASIAAAAKAQTAVTSAGLLEATQFEQTLKDISQSTSDLVENNTLDDIEHFRKLASARESSTRTFGAAAKRDAAALQQTGVAATAMSEQVQRASGVAAAGVTELGTVAGETEMRLAGIGPAAVVGAGEVKGAMAGAAAATLAPGEAAKESAAGFGAIGAAARQTAGAVEASAVTSATAVRSVGLAANASAAGLTGIEKAARVTVAPTVAAMSAATGAVAKAGAAGTVAGREIAAGLAPAEKEAGALTLALGRTGAALRAVAGIAKKNLVAAAPVISGAPPLVPRLIAPRVVPVVGPAVAEINTLGAAGSRAGKEIAAGLVPAEKEAGLLAVAADRVVVALRSAAAAAKKNLIAAAPVLIGAPSLVPADSRNAVREVDALGAAAAADLTALGVAAKRTEAPVKAAMAADAAAIRSVGSVATKTTSVVSGAAKTAAGALRLPGVAAKTTAVELTGIANAARGIVAPVAAAGVTTSRAFVAAGVPVSALGAVAKAAASDIELIGPAMEATVGPTAAAMTADQREVAALEAQIASTTAAAGGLQGALGRLLLRGGGVPGGPGGPAGPVGPLEGKLLTRGGLSGLLRSSLGLAGRATSIGLGAYIANSLVQSFTGIDLAGIAFKGIRNAFRGPKNPVTEALNQGGKLAAGLGDVPAAKLARDEATLAVQTDRAALAQEHGTHTSVQYREKLYALRTALADLATKQADVSANEKVARKANDAIVTGLRALRTQASDSEKGVVALAASYRAFTGQASSATLPVLFSVTGQTKAGAAATETAAAKNLALVQSIRAVAEANKELSPLQQHNIELIADFLTRVGRLPTEKEMRLILNNKQAKASIDEVASRYAALAATLAKGTALNVYTVVQPRQPGVGGIAGRRSSAGFAKAEGIEGTALSRAARIEEALSITQGQSGAARVAALNQQKAFQQERAAFAHARELGAKTVKARQNFHAAVLDAESKLSSADAELQQIRDEAARKAKAARDEAARKAKAALAAAKAAREKAARAYQNQIADEESSLRRAATGAKKAALRAISFGRSADAEQKKLFELPGANEGLISKGNIDLLHRKVAKLASGAIATVDSFSVPLHEGQRNSPEVLLSRVVNGRLVSMDKAIKHYRETGESLGVFKTIDTANRYAERLHSEQAKLYAHLAKPPPTVTLATGHGEAVISRLIDGRVVSANSAVAHFKKTGESLGVFKTLDAAKAYLKRLRAGQTSFYDSLGGSGSTPPTGLIAKLKAADDAEVAFYRTQSTNTKLPQATRRRYKDDLAKALDQRASDLAAIGAAITKHKDDLVNLALGKAELAAKTGLGSDAKAAALQDRADAREKKLLRDQIARATRRADDVSLGAAAQSAAITKANALEDKLLALTKSETDRHRSVLSLAVESAAADIDLAKLNHDQGKVDAGVAVEKKALQRLAAADRKRANNLRLSLAERVQAKHDYADDLQKLLALDNKTSGSGFSLAQLGQYGASQFQEYGSNIAPRGTPLSPQDERAAFGKVLKKLAKKKHPPVIIQNFHNPQDPYAATRAAQLAAEHQYIGGV